MEPILCEKCKRRVVKVVGHALTACVCTLLVGSLVVTDSVGVPGEDMGQLNRTYRERGQVVLHVPAGVLPESFHVSVHPISGDWTVQQVIPVTSSSGDSVTFNLG